MEKMNDLKALLQNEVRDLISVEDQIIEAMPAMIELASNNQLKEALQKHLAITEKQRTRLDEVQKLVGDEQGEGSGEENKGFLSGLLEAIGSGGDKCKGMEGIITESQKILKAEMDAEVKDAAIIACAQKIEHYEICGYGTARAYAMQLNLGEAENLLQETLGEEYEADDRLTQLAYTGINEKAEAGDPAKAPAKKPQSAGAKNNAKKAAAKKKEEPKKVVESNVKKVPKKAPAKSENSQPKKAAVKSSAPKKLAPKKAAEKRGN
jgi:ferritin-like metal-binding protein YciE